MAKSGKKSVFGDYSDEEDFLRDAETTARCLAAARIGPTLYGS